MSEDHPDCRSQDINFTDVPGEPDTLQTERKLIPLNAKQAETDLRHNMVSENEDVSHTVGDVHSQVTVFGGSDLSTIPEDGMDVNVPPAVNFMDPETIEQVQSTYLCRTMACFHVISISLISGGDHPCAHYLQVTFMLQHSL